MAKKQTGKLRNMHIRIREADYDAIVATCKAMDITIAEYFNSLLRSDGYDEMIRYAKIIDKEPRTVNLVVQNKDDKEKLDRLVEALNNATQQTRKIGVNVSALIRDIRNGKVNAHAAIPYLEKLGQLMEQQMASYQSTGAKLAEQLFSEEHIWKFEPPVYK